MDERWALSRRQFLRTLSASGAITASDLAWWEEPLLSPRKAHGAAPARFQFSMPEPKRTALVESLVERFNKSQSDVEVKVESVPQGVDAFVGGKSKAEPTWDSHVRLLCATFGWDFDTVRAGRSAFNQARRWGQTEDPVTSDPKGRAEPENGERTMEVHP